MNGKDWLRKNVRVYSGVDRAKEFHPMVEGEVIAYIDGPSICVRANDGSVTTWPVSLPIAEVADCGCDPELCDPGCDICGALGPNDPCPAER